MYFEVFVLDHVEAEVEGGVDGVLGSFFVHDILKGYFEVIEQISDGLALSSDVKVVEFECLGVLVLIHDLIFVAILIKYRI